MNLPFSDGKRLSAETILLITAVIGSTLYISLVFNDNLWMDEAFTASLIRGDINDVIRDTVSDTLPPFYNLTGKLLTLIFGFSPVVLKLFSCLPMVMLLFFGGRKLFSMLGFRSAFLYELFLFSMPHFLHYGVEIRMYSWGVFACGMAALYFVDILENRASFRGFLLFSVFAGYIHHFALVSCGMMWFLLLIIRAYKKDTDSIRDYFKSLCLFFLLYLPGLLLSAYQIKNAGSWFSMAPLTLNSILSDLRFPFVTNVTALSALLLLCLCFTVFIAVIQPVKKYFSTGLLLLSVLYLTVLFGYGVSFMAGKSLFTARYLVPSLAVFWLGAAMLFDLTIIAFNDNRYMSGVLAALIAATLVTSYLQTFREEYDPDVTYMKEFFDENLGEGDACIISGENPGLQICFGYYYPGLKRTNWKNAGTTKGNLWLFVSGENSKALENAGKYGYNPVYTGDFAFDRYSFSLYKLEKP
ncbi:MAG: hypothetical protein IJU87_09690 [Lachnospiraceae bacterium]|nr:hypothetical protein [Lachnospiraceae bacterium]